MKTNRVQANKPELHPLHPQMLKWYMKRAHHHALAQPHAKLLAKSKVYAGWHGKQHHGKVHAFALAVYLLVAVAGVAGMGQVAHAFDSWIQADWSGGVGTSASNQYADVTNLNATTPGELSIAGSSPISNWCNTSLCDANWTERRKLEIHHPDRDFNNYQVPVTVPYDSGSNYAGVRFTNEAGDTDLPYFIRQSDTNSALIYVKVTDSSPTTTIYYYYHNPAATNLSDPEAVLDLYDEFDGSTTLSGSGGYNDGKFSSTLYTGSIVEDSGVWHLNGQANSRANLNVSRNEQTAVEIGARLDSCTPGGSLLNYYSGDYNTPDESYSFDLDSCNESQFDLGTRYYSTDHNTGLNSLTRELGTNFKSYRIDLKSDGADFYTDDDITNGGRAFTKVSSTQEHATGGPFNVSSYLTGTDLELSYIYSYKTGGIVGQSVGGREINSGRVGTLTSAIFDTQLTSVSLGVVALSSQGGDGDTLIRVRSSANADMSGALDFSACPWLTDGMQIGDNNPCVTNTDNHYVQYQLFISGDAGADTRINSIGIEFAAADVTPPSAPGAVTATVGSSGKAILDGEWTNLVNGPNVPALGSHTEQPVYSWEAATDADGGSGIAGYCVYFGTDANADPLTTKGDISSNSALDTGDTCPYATSNTGLDLTQISLSNPIDDTSQGGPTYYLRIKALDGVYNSSTEVATHSFRYDMNAPYVFAAQVVGSGVLNQPVFDISWLHQLDFGGGPMTVPLDGESGMAGVKYCIADAQSQTTCIASQAWYGVDGAPPTAIGDPTGAAPSDAGSFHIDATANPNINPNGLNLLYVVAYDNAGNFTNGTTGQFDPAGIFVINLHNVAPAAPENLQVDPSTNSANSFSFSWDAPSDLYGLANKANYCWSVNVTPDAQHCNYAGAGVQTLSADAYATQPGQNTMYVVAKDEAGNIDYSHHASVTFTANTTAPGAPRNLDVIDASNKATSSWKLALSWDVPLLVGSGVDHYKILRSVDDLTYNAIGSTTATSFVDAGLSQILYYYKVEACDNANNCSAASIADSLLPTGRYTDPANIVAGPQVRDIKTRNATVFWSTDRFSDSKVAYGTSSGHYFPAEAYKSPQVTAHSLELSNLSPGTTYFFKAKWTDTDGNTGESAEMTFVTSPAPVVSDVSVQSINLDRANVRFTTSGAVKAKVYYGTSPLFGAVAAVNTSTDTSTYGLDLMGLNDGTKYFYRVNTIDSSGFEYDGSVASFTTISRPRITNVRFQTVEGEPSSTQKVTWDTNVATSSELSYGPAGSKQIETVNSDMVASHEVIIRNLQDDTQYSLIARSRDGLGNVAVSDPQQFHTALDTRPPAISELNTEASIRGTGAEARGQIIVTWKTDEPATSQVSYGTGVGASTNTKSAEDSRLSTDHIVIISDLPTSSVYSIKALSRDKGANLATSTPQSVVVGRGSDNIFSIIFNALQKIFGFKL